MMYLETITPQAIAAVNLPTGIPRLYKFNEQQNMIEVRDL
jgi:bisphosphoglycerate-dependent phosphoglycerate mutase